MDAASKIKRMLVASLATWVIATPTSLVADEPPTESTSTKACCADDKAPCANDKACCTDDKACCADGKCCDTQDAAKLVSTESVTSEKAATGEACTSCPACATACTACEDSKQVTVSVTAAKTCEVGVPCASCTECEPTATTATSLGLLSDWLMKRPRFSAQVAIHFGNSDQPAASTEDATSPCPKIQTATLTLDGCDAKLTTVPHSVQLVPHIAKPMRFLEGVSQLKIGEVTVCGHRICTGTKCYDVEDGAVESSKCDAEGRQYEEQPILVVPMAPPPPHYYESAATTNQVAPIEDAEVVVEKALANTQLSLPASTVVELLVAKTELMTRLELNEQMMQERQQNAQTVQILSERNARLATQVAVAEARQELTEALTASLIERAELAVKLASVESKPAAQHTEAVSTVKTIQEDLSNIRRQIALLKRGSPVPFATSSVGTGNPTAFGREVPVMKSPVPMATRLPRIPYDATPYVPTAQLIQSGVPSLDVPPSVEATEVDTDSASGASETVVK